MEVFVLGRWGTVDGENWDSQDAKVVCKLLGFSANGKENIGMDVPCM